MELQHHRDLRKSLHLLADLPITKIIGGHKPNINEPELLGKVLRAAQAILDGAEGEAKPMRGGSCLCYESPEGVSIATQQKIIDNSNPPLYESGAGYPAPLLHFVI